MGKWSVESLSDISHTVNTHSKTLEDIAVDERYTVILLIIIQIKQTKTTCVYVRNPSGQKYRHLLLSLRTLINADIQLNEHYHHETANVTQLQTDNCIFLYY